MMGRKINFALAMGVLITSTAMGQAWDPNGAPSGSGGSSIDFTGVQTFLDTQIPTENLGDYTMSFWLSVDEIGGEQFFIGQTSQGIHHGIRNDDNGSPQQYLHQAHWSSDHSGSTVVPTGASSDAASWVHATFTYDTDGGTAAGTGLGRIFYNGVFDPWIGDRANPDGKTPPNQAAADNFLLLGARNGGTQNYNGQIDDVGFWDHVVSDADILAIGTGAMLPTAIADPAQLFYDFNEGSGVTATSSATGAGLWDVPANHALTVPDPPPPAGPAETALPLAAGNWVTRMIGIDDPFPALPSGLSDGDINTATEARQILAFAGEFNGTVTNGIPAPTPDQNLNLNGWGIYEDHQDTRDRIDMAGDGGAAFPHDQPYPDGTNDTTSANGGIGEDFLVHASTSEPFNFKPGKYAISFASDDGGDLRVIPTDGSTFVFDDEPRNSDGGSLAEGGVPDDTISFDGTRGNDWTCGEFTVGPGGLTANIDSLMFERGGGDAYEISISSDVIAEHGTCDYVGNGFFQTLADGAFSGQVTIGTVTELLCDLDGSGGCDLVDLDLLYNGQPDGTAIANWLDQASDPANAAKESASDIYMIGDVNLDGDVNSIDLGLLLNNFGSVAGPGWGGGDLTADGSVTSVDLGQLLNNFGHASPAVASAVPEPNAMFLVGLGLLGIVARRRRR